MKMKEMRELCKPLRIIVEERWSNGFIVAAREEHEIIEGLVPLGFKVKGIGIGRDLNRGLCFLYAEKE